MDIEVIRGREVEKRIESAKKSGQLATQNEIAAGHQDAAAKRLAEKHELIKQHYEKAWELAKVDEEDPTVRTILVAKANDGQEYVATLTRTTDETLGLKVDIALKDTKPFGHTEYFNDYYGSYGLHDPEGSIGYAEFKDGEVIWHAGKILSGRGTALEEAAANLVDSENTSNLLLHATLVGPYDFTTQDPINLLAET